MDNVLLYGEYQLNRSLVRSERLSVQIRTILGATLVEKMGCSWRILSAKYYLVHPGEEIRPYEKTLNTIRVKERRAWADRVLAELEPCLVGVDTVVFFCRQTVSRVSRTVIAPTGPSSARSDEGLAPGPAIGVARRLCTWLTPSHWGTGSLPILPNRHVTEIPQRTKNHGSQGGLG